MANPTSVRIRTVGPASKRRTNHSYTKDAMAPPMTASAGLPQSDATPSTTMPTTPSSLKTFYLVAPTFSSASQVADNKVLDDMRHEITMRFPPETREKITTVRNKARNAIAKVTLSFHGVAQFAKAENIPEIMGIVSQANIDLIAIDSSLKATLVQIPISADSQARGQLYEDVVSSIRGQIYKVLLERLSKLAGKTDVPERSRIALLELCDKLAEWNVVGDEDVAQRLRNFRFQFEHGVLQPVAEDIQKALAATENAGAYVEL